MTEKKDLEEKPDLTAEQRRLVIVELRCILASTPIAEPSSILKSRDHLTDEQVDVLWAFAELNPKLRRARELVASLLRYGERASPAAAFSSGPPRPPQQAIDDINELFEILGLLSSKPS